MTNIAHKFCNGLPKYRFARTGEIYDLLRNAPSLDNLDVHPAIIDAVEQLMNDVAIGSDTIENIVRLVVFLDRSQHRHKPE